MFASYIKFLGTNLKFRALNIQDQDIFIVLALLAKFSEYI